MKRQLLKCLGVFKGFPAACYRCMRPAREPPAGGVVTRQRRRKLERDLAKVRRRIRREALIALKDGSIPEWIRKVKRKQLERRGII